MDTFPATSGTQLAASGSFSPYIASPWSPDRSKLLYNSGGLHVREMDGETPGPARLLGALSATAWSADSRSLLVGGFQPNGVINPNQAAPLVHPLPAAYAYLWAPAGSLLAYLTDEGLFVVDVVDGVPGEPLKLADSLGPVPAGLLWSPDAKRLAYWHDGVLVLITPSDPPLVDIVTQPVVSAPTVNNVAFSGDGSLLAFLGAQTREGVTDLYWVDVDDPETPKTVYPVPPPEPPSFFQWHPNLHWLHYYYYQSGPVYYAAALGSSASAQIALPAGVSGWNWLPESPKIVGRDPEGGELYLFDAAQGPGPGEVLSAPIDSSIMVIDPLGKTIAYQQGNDLAIDDFVGLATPPTILDAASDPLTWQWSPDARFLAISVVDIPPIPDQYSIRILRTDGITVSSPITIQGTSTSAVQYAWQP